MFLCYGGSQIIQLAEHIPGWDTFTKDGIYDLYLEIGNHSRKDIHGLAAPSIRADNRQKFCVGPKGVCQKCSIGCIWVGAGQNGGGSGYI